MPKAVKEVLQEADERGRTVRELIAQTGKSETTVRREVNQLISDGEAHKWHTSDGARIVWGKAKDPRVAERKPLSKKRAQASERDLAVKDVLANCGPLGLTLDEIARKIGADDIDHNGVSSKTYLSVRRLNKSGQAERMIRWRLTTGESPADVEAASGLA